MPRLENFLAIISKPKYLVVFIAFSIAVFLLFGNLSGLLQNPFFASKRMLPATSMDYGFLILVSVLSGLLFAAIFRKTEEPKRALGKEGFGAGGTILGYLTIACPSCSLAFFSLLGIQANLLALYPFRLELRILSTIVLFIALFFALENNKCPLGVGKRGKG